MKEFAIGTLKILIWIAGLGWAANEAIEAKMDVKVEMVEKMRSVDMNSLNKRLDRIESQNDTIINHLINKEKR